MSRRPDSDSHHRQRIALVVFGDPWLLPPTLNAAELLAARGWEVDVLGIQWRSGPRLDGGNVGSVRIEILAEVGGGIGYTPTWFAFATRALSRAVRRRYDWVYAYDMMAAPVGQAMARLASARFGYHVHDLSTNEDVSRQQRFLGSRGRELAAARAADLVVLPQPARAHRFAGEAGLSRSPIVAWNCPRLSWPNGGGEIDTRVASLKRRVPRLLLYQGGLGVERGLDLLIESLPFWPEGIGLVVAGFDAPHGRLRALAARAEALGMSGRTLFVPPLPYLLLPSVTRACELGVLLVGPDARDVNLRLHAGASNKIFEYMACGLRLIVPDTPDFAALVEAPGHGFLLRDRTPRGLGVLVGEALSAQHDAMGPENAAAFRREFNYEHQFAPVVARLEETPATRHGLAVAR